MGYVIIGVITLLIGFFVGLLVGKRNPIVADAAQKFSDAVKATSEKVK